MIKRMKKNKLNMTVLLFILSLFASCGSNDNFGYPSKIVFGREGGTRICSGTSSCYVLEITNYNGDGKTSQALTLDSLEVTYDWLTIKSKRPNRMQLEMTAAPNHTGKRRTLYVHGMVNNDAAEIKVVQY